MKRPLRRDRAITLAAIAALTVFSWWNFISGSGSAHPAGMHTHCAGPRFWPAAQMWALMMIGMMAPSALPFLSTFRALVSRRRPPVHPLLLTAFFFSGYCLVWAGFSIVAAAGQVGLQTAALLAPMSLSLSPASGGAMLIAAGAYQWTRAKDACLRNCRSPVAFLVSEWRDGAAGACAMGLRHGLFCLGCCWLIMLLPFAAGVMNLAWMAAITLFILIEKALPGGEVLGRAAGVLLAIYGAWMIWGAFA